MRQIRPGYWIRQPLVKGRQPFTYLRVVPETAELLGKYSEAEVWQDVKFRELSKLLEGLDQHRRWR